VSSNALKDENKIQEKQIPQKREHSGSVVVTHRGDEGGGRQHRKNV